MREVWPAQPQPDWQRIGYQSKLYPSRQLKKSAKGIKFAPVGLGTRYKPYLHNLKAGGGWTMCAPSPQTGPNQ